MENRGLSLESLGYLNYLRSVLAQPNGSWEGFYDPLSPSMNFALRYQLAFGSYAVAGMAQQTPAYRTPYAEALRGAIEKMLDGESWRYWRVDDEDNVAGSGHVAVLLSPHRTAVTAPPSDPVARDNLQYSGHLSTMLGLYEKVSGDSRYDEPFTLLDTESGANFTYTHGQVAGRIHSQMVQNRFGGVCCESGMAYVPCNNHGMASNALHDALHGTDFSQANGRWLTWVRKRMVLKGPAVRGVFGAAYAKDFHMAAPVAFNFTDAWGLALMLPFDAELVRKLYRRFRTKITREGSDLAYLDSTQVSEKMEISDVPINTGFALIAASGVQDTRTGQALRNYAYGAFDAGWQGSKFMLKGAARTLHATALYALASALSPGPGDLTSLFRAAPDRDADSEPYLDQVEPGDGSVGVSRAEYRPAERTLSLALRQVGDRGSLKKASPVTATLTLGNVPAVKQLRVNGEWVELSAVDSNRVVVNIPPGEATAIEMTV